MKNSTKLACWLALLISAFADRARADVGDCLQYPAYDDQMGNTLYFSLQDEQTTCMNPYELWIWAPTGQTTPEECGNCPLRYKLTKAQKIARTAGGIVLKGDPRLPQAGGLSINHHFKKTVPATAKAKYKIGNPVEWEPASGALVQKTKWIKVEDATGSYLPVKLYVVQLSFGKEQGLIPNVWKQQTIRVGFEMKRMPNSEEELAPEVAPSKLDGGRRYVGSVRIDEEEKPFLVITRKALFN